VEITDMKSFGGTGNSTATWGGCDP